MTGDNHGSARTSRPASRPRTRRARRAARSPTGSASAPPPTSTRARLPDDATAQAVAGQGLRDRASTSTPTARTGRRPAWPSFYHDQLADFVATFPSLAPLATNRTHCIAWSDWATQPKVELAERHPPRHQLLLLAADWVDDPPGLLHRLGHADALRRPRRLDDRRLPGDDADDRRVGPDLPVHDRHAARPGARRGGLLRRLHRQHPHRRRVGGPRRRRSSPRRRPGSVPVVSAKQMLTWLDGRNTLDRSRTSPGGPASLSFGISVGRGRERPAGHGAGGIVGGESSRAVTRGGSPVAYTTQTIKGISYAIFAAPAGSYAVGTARRLPTRRRRSSRA